MSDTAASKFKRNMLQWSAKADAPKSNFVPIAKPDVRMIDALEKIAAYRKIQSLVK